MLLSQGRFTDHLNSRNSCPSWHSLQATSISRPSPAIPIYPNTRPYQRIPFQWSWHYNDGSGSLIHSDFLASGDIDPRREFSETLLLASERFPGAVMAWSQFEEKVVRDMAELFPDLAERLTALLYRIVDLLELVRDHIVHPAF